MANNAPAGVGGGGAGGAGAGAGGDPQPKSKRSSAVKVRTRGGMRTMKMFSLTEGELGELSLLRGISAACFSGASALFGFWVSVKQAIAFADKLSPVTQATWDTWTLASLIAAIVLALVGVGFAWRGSSRLSKIQEEMEHDA